MSFSKDENSDLIPENMEQEDKVNVEEASVNLGHVKKELNEEELAFDDNQYKIALTIENVLGQSSTEQESNRHSWIDFLDGDVIMKIEMGTVKLEDHCNKCGETYQGYCVNCSSLSHILNNITPNLNTEPVLNTTPTNILEIREVSRGCAVFALKTLPKRIILGPFEGIAPIESTTGLQWKIKDKKLVNDQNGNWMKYIQSVPNPSTRNLDVFQFDATLYFETCREVQGGEELLVCYREEKEDVLKSDKEEVFYLVPAKKEEYPKVFACTLCSLGFGLESCLVEHKSKCPHKVNNEDFEIIQCRCCKVWLEKEEHLESHMLHCRENYNRLCRNRNLPDFAPTYTDNEEQVDEYEEITTSIDVNASHSILDSKNCVFRTEVHKEEYFHDYKNMGTTHSNTINLKSHLGTHTQHLQCDICKQSFNHKRSLQMHIKDKHSNTNEKEYKCCECAFQTNLKSDLNRHLVSHTNIKHFQCDICKLRFGRKDTLILHIKNKHSNTNEKEYKCSECAFQTNLKRDLNRHLVSHTDVKDFQCDICKKRFGRKDHLRTHIKNIHSNTNEKVYKCCECSYQTSCKSSLKSHLGTHTGVKAFECDICKQRFGQKSYLKRHIKYKHSNTNEKEYKCSECSYQTNDKRSLKSHLDSHIGVKAFECDSCKQRFGRKSNLTCHIKNKHSNTNEKEYKCSECAFQTNIKSDLNRHLAVHTNVKHFQCDICKLRFSRRYSLNLHIKDKHSNTNEKEYQCSKCPYQTNYKGSLKIHLVSHTDVKDFQCDICKQRFGQKGNLKLHIKGKHSNTNEKEYKCSECAFQTNYKCNLNAHLVSHTDVKDFQCDICKQRFGRKDYLRTHIKNIHSNTNEKEYKCSECSYQTNDKLSLKSHLDSHIGVKAFECDICKQRFGRKSHLTRHIKNKHSNTN